EWKQHRKSPTLSFPSQLDSLRYFGHISIVSARNCKPFDSVDS
ncbi:unnamed protein product, partial [Cuscuta campestris]